MAMTIVFVMSSSFECVSSIGTIAAIPTLCKRHVKQDHFLLCDDRKISDASRNDLQQTPLHPHQNSRNPRAEVASIQDSKYMSTSRNWQEKSHQQVMPVLTRKMDDQAVT